MEVKATAKYLKVQPRKVRIIADEVRGMEAVYAIHKLRYHTSKSAKMLRKVVINAIANAAENNNIGSENLKISTIEVNEGPRQKRIQARAMGRANRILKKTSHITVGVTEVEAKQVTKAHGTKAKPRPTFAKVAPKKAEAKKVEAVVEAPVADVTTTEEGTN
jgi:large subunit ribosomal protein L22